uniref:Chitin-binding type-2 domain-containing protein n=1 Tax=Timema poppense TaxID=170557 RepID=A0A7R9DQJ3_TIMPO|nr:unnamed protein product [Timema poppensis]
MYTDVFNFSCPKVDMAEAGTHPRYADPEDCQFFYVCINGEVPRRSGCKMGQVFNEVKGTCDWPRNVPECVDWYKGILTDEQLATLVIMTVLLQCGLVQGDINRRAVGSPGESARQAQVERLLQDKERGSEETHGGTGQVILPLWRQPAVQVGHLEELLSLLTSSVMDSCIIFVRASCVTSTLINLFLQTSVTPGKYCYKG